MKTEGRPGIPVREPEMDERLKREAEFFNQPHIDLLHFLKRGSTRFDRWLIGEVLKSWDKQLAFLDPAWIRDKVVLEACCGNPRVLHYFHGLGARRLMGCDVAKEFVVDGLKNPQTFVFDKRIRCGSPPFQMLFADVGTLPLREGVVDTVCCFQALHHVDLNRFARECERILVSGGHVFISDPIGVHPLRDIADWVGKKIGPMSGDEKSYDPEKVIQDFESCGFKVLEFYSLNPFSEIYFQVTELFTRYSSALSFYLKLPMWCLNRIEPYVERKLLPRHPQLGWRFALSLEKKA